MSDDKFTELSRTAAMMLVMARAFNLWNKRLEKLAHELRHQHTRETKMALGMIEDGCKKATIGLNHFEDWATASGVTESGHTGDIEACDAYIKDAGWLAYLAGATFNAAKYDEDIRTKVDSMCKLATKGDPLIDWETLKQMLPK